MPGIRLNSLSSLRFLAASAVVIYHLLPGWVGVNYLLWPRMLLNLLGLACVGLPFFYALSGFVLYYVYREDPPRERKKLFLFWVKRFARIAPTFYLSLLLGIWPFLQELIAAHGTGPGLVRTALYLIANLFFLSAWLPFTLNFNFPTWSISVEIFCYLLFPFLLQRAARLSRAETWFGLACAYFTGAVIQGGAVLIWPELAHWPYEPGNLSSNLTNFLQLNPLVHLPEFLFGVLLGRLWHLQKGERPRGDACLLGGIVLLILFLETGIRWPFLMLTSFLFLPLEALLLWGGAGRRGALTEWLERPRVVLLGESTYAMYVLHVPLGIWWAKLVGTGSPYWSFLGYFAMLCLVSVMLHLYFEVPLRTRLVRIFEERK